MKQVIRYKCSFCSRLAARPETIMRHEAECLHNPAGRNCYQCKFSTEGGVTDTPFGEIVDEHIPFCELEGIPLPQLRAEGYTAVNCEHFVRDDKNYNERNKENVRKEIETYFSF